MTVGETLAKERQKRKLSLDQVSEQTKIAKMYLKALEADDLAALPPGVYCRAFLRAYGEFLGLPLDKLLGDFHDQFGLKTQDHLLQEQKQLDEKAFLRQRRRLFLLVLLAIVASTLLLALTWGYLRHRDEPPRSSSGAGESKPVSGVFFTEAGVQQQGPLPVESLDAEPEGDPDAPLVPFEVEPAANNALEAKASAPLPAESAFPPETAFVRAVGLEGNLPVGQVFGVKALGSVWVEVFVDGQLLTRRLLLPGELRYYRVGRTNQLKIGDGSLVGLYEGGAVRQPVSSQPLYISKLEFQGGELWHCLDLFLAKAKEESP